MVLVRITKEASRVSARRDSSFLAKADIARVRNSKKKKIREREENYK